VYFPYNRSVELIQCSLSLFLLLFHVSVKEEIYNYVLLGLKKDDEEAAAIENDWKFAAMVLDRSSFQYFLEIVLYLFNEKLLLPPN
jgi:hypothetical protein